MKKNKSEGFRSLVIFVKNKTHLLFNKISRMKIFFKKNFITLITLFSLAFVIGGWIYTYYSLNNLGTTERGTFGDMFGGINSLFSGLAFCGIIISIMMQSEELKLQREEIKQNREELKGSRIAQEEQGKSLHRQAENLKISAKLSALNTLVNYYTEKANMDKESSNTFNSRFAGAQNIQKAEKYVKEIENILNKKNV